jgi:hypothetical protein
MIRITVPALPIRNMKGIGKESGKPYDMNIQTVYCYIVDTEGNPLPFPEKSEIVLEPGQVGYAPGDYTLSPASLFLNRNRKMEVAPRLVPLKSRSA